MSMMQALINREIPTNAVRLNLGCGGHLLSYGFINIDRQWVGPVSDGGADTLRFQQHNLLKGIPYEDNSVDYIVCHHFLEHLTYEQGRSLLLEVARVLKKGGRISLVTPDFAWLVSQYRSNVGTLEQTANLMLFCEGPDGDKHRSAYDRVLLTRLAWESGLYVSEIPVSELPYLVADVQWQCGILCEKRK
jgi:SAM-dependent methyltransferase